MTVALATPGDVEERLGRPLTPDEQNRTDPGLLDEASDLVVGYLGADPSADGTVAVPPPVARVVARMVARVLQQSTAAGGVFGATSMTDQIGDFSQTRQFPAGATSGGPWLTQADKVALKPYRSGGPYTVDTLQSVVWHADVCGVNLGAGWCSCGADLTLAGPLWETD